MKAQEYFAADLIPSRQHTAFLRNVRYGAIGTTALLLGGLDAFILSITPTSL